MLYTQFSSASKKHIEWLSQRIYLHFRVKGKVNFGGRIYQLRYAKSASVTLLNGIYYSDVLICLTRKRFKIQQALAIIQKSAGML
ncbi:hypothetical protein A3D25_00880 [Candidatus Daviesbacteria bacterium RIFCSPHIGHO2_02_FULL_43_12]|uniref:Homing endonuclease LAGLIDADG domain-containing protein n=1 Tax=Candidatus Daviesbacteria bacterium RIFCSPHIGHO2_02_FULL_43_12 TaxID=1797776 RepID=A0A1F5KJK8_9BACT|nr:MAG: hypothetical protein A3D25_00880 [Candidatus Daviesbacteria bacterium RIFCSPHIGHO2_02_FULL_43_12]